MADINVTIEDAQPINVSMGEAVNYFVSDVPGPKGEPGVQGEPGADGLIQSIVAGENVTVDSTDPANPIISSAGGGGGGGASPVLVAQTILDNNSHTLQATDIDPTGEGGYYKAFLEVRAVGGHNLIYLRVNGGDAGFSGREVNYATDIITNTSVSGYIPRYDAQSGMHIIEIGITVAPSMGMSMTYQLNASGTSVRSYMGRTATETTLNSIGIYYGSVTRNYIGAGSKISVYKYC